MTGGHTLIGRLSGIHQFGLRHRGASAGASWAVKEAYRIVLMSDRNSSQTEAPLEAGGNVFPEAQRFIDAITRSRSGISK